MIRPTMADRTRTGQKSTPFFFNLGSKAITPNTLVRPPPNFFFFAISEAQKRGVQFFCHRTTLSAISRAVDGVEQRLNIPSHLTLPCASVGYLISALQRAPAELDPSPRCKFPANFLQISGRRRHWALYLTHIDPRQIDRID